MTFSLVDPGILRRWIVCESTDRWLTAVRRFAPEMMPDPLVPRILPATPEQALRLAVSGEPTVVLWEVGRESISLACDCLAQAAKSAPNSLQIVAGSELSDRDLILLSEFRAAATIRHPEDLIRLTHMIHVYFARCTHHLD